MPADEYKSFGGGGALKLKGAKVDKKKKKKKTTSNKPDLEKNLSPGDEKAVTKRRGEEQDDRPHDEKTASDDNDGERPAAQKTESERRYEETRKKRVSHTFGIHFLFPTGISEYSMLTFSSFSL
jgi:protein FAM32A